MAMDSSKLAADLMTAITAHTDIRSIWTAIAKAIDDHIRSAEVTIEATATGVMSGNSTGSVKGNGSLS